MRALPRLGWPALLALMAGLPALGPVAASAQAGLGVGGTRAFRMARAADDAALAAREEGEQVLRALRKLEAGGAGAEPLAALQAEAAALEQTLAGYRGQAQASAVEALELLAGTRRSAGGAAPDAVRREVLEQRALLAAHEAAVMAARARATTERIRALHAEARALLVTAERPDGGDTPGVRGEGARARGASRGLADARGEVAVPNLIGARLDAATRDLEAAGLRVGARTGPAEGFVVKQEPAAGVAVRRPSAVDLTLSATAASVTEAPLR